MNECEHGVSKLGVAACGHCLNNEIVVLKQALEDRDERIERFRNLTLSAIAYLKRGEKDKYFEEQWFMVGLELTPPRAGEKA